MGCKFRCTRPRLGLTFSSIKINYCSEMLWMSDFQYYSWNNNKKNLQGPKIKPSVQQERRQFVM